ncbi:MAG: peptidase M18 [Ignavibacteriae bacterium]|nr:peptidase M18 [Ignavibacteriota bacterium]
MKIFFFLSLLFVSQVVSAQSVWQSKTSSWLTISPEQRKECFTLNDNLKKYLDKARNELTSTKEVLALAKSKGFKEFTEPSQVKPGAKLWINNRDRAVALVVVGSNQMITGSRLIATHHDSPRIDIKARPLYDASGYGMLQTIFYGGIKKYHWANIPLMLIGRVDTKDGKTIEVSIGDDPDEPVLIIPDAAPHADAPLRTRVYTGVFEGEELDPIVGSIPSAKGNITSQVMATLTEQFGITEEDLVSAELNLVPATSPRDVGLDKALTAAYGQDDRLCSFVAVNSILGLSAQPTFTSIAYLTDNEETGSINNTGAQSSFLSSLYGRLTEAELGTKYTDNETRKALHNAQVISADVNDGINPLFPNLSEASNAARLGFGVAIKRYGRSFDANSEFTARIRKVLDDNTIPWQTASYKVESGGGGTIGGFMSKEDMEVIDIGIPILSMHSTYEVSSKVDVWNLNKFFTAFYLLGK